jgi:hypothetical protein
MALNATYDPTLSRVRLLLTGANGAATHAVFERSTDAGVRWTTIRGGADVAISGGSASRDDYEFEPGVPLLYRVRTYAGVTSYDAFTAPITQDLDQVWLKVPAIPFLNTPVVVVAVGPISRRSRGGVLDVVARNYPVQVGDVRSMRAFDLQILTETAAEERDMDARISTGDVVFLQSPAAVESVPEGYFSVGDVTRDSTLRLSPRKVWTLPLIEVAAPGPDVIGPAYTCASVLAEYVTVTAMLAENATILDLLSRTGTPSEVLVP